MGILLLPSLEEKRSIRVENLSESEARAFIKEFDSRVVANRTIKNPSAIALDSVVVYKLLEGLEDYDLEEIVEELSESVVPQTRGLRAVFADDKTDTILVGTTVVYSRNWATVNFLDTTIPQTILDFEL